MSYKVTTQPRTRTWLQQRDQATVPCRRMLCIWEKQIEFLKETKPDDHAELLKLNDKYLNAHMAGKEFTFPKIQIHLFKFLIKSHLIDAVFEEQLENPLSLENKIPPPLRSNVRMDIWKSAQTCIAQLLDKSAAKCEETVSLSAEDFLIFDYTIKKYYKELLNRADLQNIRTKIAQSGQPQTPAQAKEILCITERLIRIEQIHADVLRNTSRHLAEMQLFYLTKSPQIASHQERLAVLEEGEKKFVATAFSTEIEQETKLAEQKKARATEKRANRLARQDARKMIPVTYSDSSSEDEEYLQNFASFLSLPSSGKWKEVQSPPKHKKQQNFPALMKVFAILQSPAQRIISLSPRVSRWLQIETLNTISAWEGYEPLKLQQLQRTLVRHFHPALTGILQHPELTAFYFTERTPPQDAKANTTHLEAQCRIANSSGLLEISMEHTGNDSSIYHAYFRPNVEQEMPQSLIPTVAQPTNTAFKTCYPEGGNTSLPPHLHTTYRHLAIEGSWDCILQPKNQ